MRINFYIDSEAVEFHHEKVFGQTELRNETGVVVLHSAVNVAHQFKQSALTVTWQANWLGHDVIVQRKRPLWFPIFRPMNYTIWVDGQFVIEASG